MLRYLLLCTIFPQVILSSLVQLATINHQVSSEALDVLLNLLSSLQGEQKINTAIDCMVSHNTMSIIFGGEGEESVFLLSVFPIMFWGYIAGPEGLMVCQTLVAIAAHTTNIWDHVTPKLMTYLESKAEDHHEILVS